MPARAVRVHLCHRRPSAASSRVKLCRFIVSPTLSNIRLFRDMCRRARVVLACLISHGLQRCWSCLSPPGPLVLLLAVNTPLFLPGLIMRMPDYFLGWATERPKALFSRPTQKVESSMGTFSDAVTLSIEALISNTPHRQLD